MEKIRILLPLVLLGIFISCNRKDESIIQLFSLENFDFSDCKAGKSAFVEGSRSMDYHIDESMEYHYTEGDKLYLVHRNVYFNCCQPENNLQVETSLVGDSIIVNEYEKKPGNAGVFVRMIWNVPWGLFMKKCIG